MKTYLILGILVLLIIALMVFIRRRREHFTGNACVITQFGPVTKDKGVGVRPKDLNIELDTNGILGYKGAICLQKQLASKNLNLFTIPELMQDDLSKIQVSDINAIISNHGLDASKKMIGGDTEDVVGNKENIANFIRTVVNQISSRPINTSKASSAKNRFARTYILTDAPTNSECGPIKTTNSYC